MDKVKLDRIFSQIDQAFQETDQEMREAYRQDQELFRQRDRAKKLKKIQRETPKTPMKKAGN